LRGILVLTPPKSIFCTPNIPVLPPKASYFNLSKRGHVSVTQPSRGKIGAPRSPTSAEASTHSMVKKSRLASLPLFIIIVFPASYIPPSYVLVSCRSFPPAVPSRPPGMRPGPAVGARLEYCFSILPTVDAIRILFSASARRACKPHFC